MGSIHEKNRGQQSRDTTPLRFVNYCPQASGQTIKFAAGSGYG